MLDSCGACKPQQWRGRGGAVASRLAAALNHKGRDHTTKVTQHLRFEKDMETAISFYTSLIPGSSVSWTAPNPRRHPQRTGRQRQSGGLHARRPALHGHRGRPLDPFNHSFSIIVECESQAEIDRLWEALKQGGRTEQCGWLRDRWGLCWQITPKQLGELMRDPDPAKAKRVTEAMLKMAKFDIADLEAAAKGEAF